MHNMSGYGPEPVPAVGQQRRPSPVPWIITAVAVLLAVAAVVWGLTRPSTSDAGAEAGSGLAGVITEGTFATPEEAVRHVAGRLAEGDVDGAFQAVAITSPAQNWDQVAYSDRLRAITPQDPPNPKDPFFTSSFTLWRLSQVGGQIRNVALSLVLPEDLEAISDYQAVPLTDDLTAQTVVDAMQVGQLTGLTVEQVGVVALSESDRYQENMAQQLQAMGAQEMKEVGVLYGYDGQTYLGGATVVRFGERWLIWTLSSAMMNTEVSGALVPASAQDFQDALGSN